MTNWNLAIGISDMLWLYVTWRTGYHVRTWSLRQPLRVRHSDYSL